MPVSTKMIATKPLGDDLAHELIPLDACIEDVHYIFDYYCLSANKLCYLVAVRFMVIVPQQILR